MFNVNDYNREFVSFSGCCPYMCNHCYTFSNGYESLDSGNSISEIINKLQGTQNIGIIYISGHKENFVNPDEGLNLCEQLFDMFKCDLLLTTRNIFNVSQVDRLKKLDVLMKLHSKSLYFCASIPALNSYKKLEPNALIPNPMLRIKNLNEVFDRGIHTILTLRPLCPNSYIPSTELLEIIDMCKNFTSAVLSSGIMVNEDILNKLERFPSDIDYIEESLPKCLKNDIPMKKVNVNGELNIIRQKCQALNLPFFTESLSAIEYLKNKEQRN